MGTRAALMVIALVFGIVSSPTAQGAKPSVDVSGRWQFDVNSAMGGKTTPVVTLTQEGEKIKGHYSSQTKGFGEINFVGTVKGNAIRFSFTIVRGEVEVVYIGTVKTKDLIEGRVTATELGDGTFTATRKS